MNRADRLAMALTKIVDMERITRTGYHEPSKVFMEIDRIAREALDAEIPWPGEVQYNAPQDHAIARRWMEKHEKADELVFVHGRPILALYFEPVAEHYQGARQVFRKLAEQLRAGWEEEWFSG
jgi:hypothetical protein